MHQLIVAHLLKLLVYFRTYLKHLIKSGLRAYFINSSFRSIWASILQHLLFSVYINDLAEDLSSTAKLAADDTSVFSFAHDINFSPMQLNDDLSKIAKWANQ